MSDALERAYEALSALNTAEIFDVLGEIVEPSIDGPFGRSYVEDDFYQPFLDEMLDVTRTYRDAFDRVESMIGFKG